MPRGRPVCFCTRRLTPVTAPKLAAPSSRARSASCLIMVRLVPALQWRELTTTGVDALNTSLGVVIFCGAVNFGQTWWTVLVLFASLCSFYLTTWEEYHTGTLYLGLVSGPVEGVLIISAVYATTTFVGGNFWQRPMLAELGLPAPNLLPDFLKEMSFAQWNLVCGGVILAFNIFQSSQNVVRARRAKSLPVGPALAGLAPFFVPWAAIAAWLALRPEILHRHLVPFIFFVGVSFAYQVGLMITAHLTKSGFPFVNMLFLPIFFGAADALGPWLRQIGDGKEGSGYGWASLLGEGPYEIAYVFCSLGLAIGVHGSFIVDVITNICDYLDIWCLTIKHPMTEEPEKTVKAS